MLSDGYKSLDLSRLISLMNLIDRLKPYNHSFHFVFFLQTRRNHLTSTASVIHAFALDLATLFACLGLTQHCKVSHKWFGATTRTRSTKPLFPKELGSMI